MAPTPAAPTRTAASCAGAGAASRQARRRTMASQCSTARHWPWVVLVAVVLAVAPAYATNSVTSVSHDTAVKGVSRTVTFTGPGVAPGDRVFWMDNRPDCDVIPINSEGVLVLDQSNSVQVTFDTVSTPLYPFRLCYRFGSTPYQRYITMMMEVKGITSMSETEFVVGVDKTVQFLGTGAADGDTAIFVPQGATDCSGTAEGSLAGTDASSGQLTIVEAGTSFQFSAAPSITSGKLALCYAFGAEPLALFPDVVVNVGFISKMRVTGGNGGNYAIVVGQPKSFTFQGTGIRSGDKVKVVPGSATSDEHCTSLPASGTLTDGGALGVTVGSAGSAVIKTLETSPKALPFRLCYKFGSHPWRLYTTHSLTSRGIFSVSKGVVMAGTSNKVVIAGIHFSRTDRAKWVEAGAACDSVSDDDAAGGSTAVTPWFDFSTPALNRNFATDQHAHATFTFTRPGVGWQLCFKFGVERYHRFDAVTISGLRPAVAAVSHDISVVGVGKTYELRGTVGIADTERVKWVENIAADCSGPGLGLTGADVDPTDNSVPVSVNPNPALTAPTGDIEALARTGRASVTLTFKTPSPDFLPWRLCYKYGDAPYHLFPSVTMVAKALTSVHVRTSATGGDIVIGEATNVVFKGQGVKDGDRAKFVVDKLNAPCTQQPAGGSSEVVIKERQGVFTFKSAVTSLLLCYKFGEEAYIDARGVAVVLQTQAIPGPVLDLERALVKLRMFGNIETVRPGTGVRDTYNVTLRADLATALRIPESRIVIARLQPGSIVASFWLFPSNNPAEASVRQLVATLRILQGRLTSSLYAGGVTKDVDPDPSAISARFTSAELEQVPGYRNVSDVTVAALSDTEEGDSVPLRVRAFQSRGLFQFTSAEVRATEGSTVTLTVTRLHGVAGNVAVRCVTVEETASVGHGDYEPVDSVLRFSSGDTVKTLTVTLRNDDVDEAHYETFYVTAELYGGEHEAAIGTIATTTVRIYDWVRNAVTHPRARAASVFNIAAGTHASADPETPVEAFKGWSLTGNGNSGPGAVLLDVNGIYGVDRVYEGSDYNSRCDYAAPLAPCEYSCEYGAPYETSLGAATGVLSMTSGGHVAASATLSDFPDVELSVTMWVRVLPQYASTSATLLSYAVHDPSHADNPLARDFMEFMVSDTSNLRVMVHGRVVNTRRGLKTMVNIGDGEWHFIGITWRSSDGSVMVHDNGRVACDSGPYKTQHRLQAGGTLVLGGQQRRVGCRDGEGLGPDGAPCGWAGVLDPARGFTGNVQNLRLWNYVLSPADVGQGMVWPFVRSRVGLILYWRFEEATVTKQPGRVNPYDGAVVRDLGTGGVDHPGVFSAAGVSVLSGSDLTAPGAPGTPSVHPSAQCGQVHTNIWYFSASQPFRGDQELAYDGRLQFRRLSPSHAGAVRNARGSIVVTGGPEGDEMRISYPLAGFASPGVSQWTRYSVILREDHGWVHEPSNARVATDEMRAVLRRVTGLFIRGDEWSYSDGGSGQEVVYLNDVALVSRVRDA